MKKTKKVDTNVHGTIISFSEKDNVSHVPLFKNMAKVVKDQFGSKKRATVRFMELTIKDAFDLFCQENPKVLLKIINQRISY